MLGLVLVLVAANQDGRAGENGERPAALMKLILEEKESGMTFVDPTTQRPYMTSSESDPPQHREVFKAELGQLRSTLEAKQALRRAQEAETATKHSKSSEEEDSTLQQAVLVLTNRKSEGEFAAGSNRASSLLFLVDQAEKEHPEALFELGILHQVRDPQEERASSHLTLTSVWHGPRGGRTELYQGQ